MASPLLTATRFRVRRRTGAGHADVRRLVTVTLIWSMMAACSGSGSGDPASPASGAPVAATVARDYWPTTGWRTAAPAEHRVDAAALAKVEDQVARFFPEVRSVLVVRGGYLVYERYWHGLDAADGHDVRSVTKSVIGTLIGIAVADRKVSSLEQTVGQLLPDRLPPNADPRMATVTVRQLLAMTSGLAGDPAEEDALFRSPDWVRQILGRRLISEPGARFAYSSAGSHLLSAIVAAATGQSTLAYARTRLFTPLGINTAEAFEPVLAADVDPLALETYQRAAVAWPIDPQGHHFGGAFLRLPARDLAKLGYLYLNGGRWDGNQVIPADYVTAATTLSGPSAGQPTGYGLHWWVAEEGGHHTFRAEGFGGQFIYVVPDLDLVVVMTNDPDKGPNPRSLIMNTIVPAVTN
jgi:CubicO group peptidase (beta-lactamase class C family)